MNPMSDPNDVWILQLESRIFELEDEIRNLECKVEEAYYDGYNSGRNDYGDAKDMENEL